MFEFNFKVAFTAITNKISVDPLMTVSQLISLINNYKTDYFNIHENYDIEIVEAGNNINGRDEEILEEKYGFNNKWKYISFYIRPINRETGQFITDVDYSIDPNN
jgi:hypothetical protein